MARRKIVHILFFIGALSFVARPFLGYALFNSHRHPPEDSILIKVFSKRKPDLSEDSKAGYSAIEKKLANPGLNILPTFYSFLDALFPSDYDSGAQLKSGFLLAMRWPVSRPGWLLHGQIII